MYASIRYDAAEIAGEFQDTNDEKLIEEHHTEPPLGDLSNLPSQHFFFQQRISFFQINNKQQDLTKHDTSF